MGTSRGPANHPSGDLKILRKCCNGLTNRHSAINQMMITIPRKMKLIMKIYDLWRPGIEGIR